MSQGRPGSRPPRLLPEGGEMDKSALQTVSYGVYVVSARTGDRLNGQICNTVFQVTAEPPQLAISVNRENYTHHCLRESGSFSVAVLSEKTPLKYIGRFGFRCGRDFDKFGEIDYICADTGSPVPTEYAVAYIDCRISEEFDCGTHSLFLGEVVGAERLGDDPPMTYDYYHRVVKGKSPSRAPTFAG